MKGDFEYCRVSILADENKEFNRRKCYVGIRDSKCGLVVYLTDYHLLLYGNGRNVKRSSDNSTEVWSLARFLNWVLKYAPKEYSNAFYERGVEVIDFDLCEMYLALFADGQIKGMRDLPSPEYQGNQISMLTRLLRSVYHEFRPEEESKHYFSYTEKHGKYSNTYYELDMVENDEKEGKLLRYLPPEVGAMMLTEAYRHDRGIYLALFFQYFGALRSGEVCNVRRYSGKYGRGYNIERDTEAYGKVKYFSINLKHEYILRGDLVSTGKIKKERFVTIPAEWLKDRSEFGLILDWHETRLKKLKTEEYGAFFINRRLNPKTGVYMAMTRSNYEYRVKRLFDKYVIPAIRASKNDTLISWADEVLEKHWGPHWGRDLATIRYCLLPGVTSSDVMDFRGDKNEDSALTYLKHSRKYKDLYEYSINKSFKELMDQACRAMRR